MCRGVGNPVAAKAAARVTHRVRSLSRERKQSTPAQREGQLPPGGRVKMVRKVSCDNHCSLRQCRPVRARCVRVWAGAVVRKPRSCIEKRFPSTCDCVLHSTASASADQANGLTDVAMLLQAAPRHPNARCAQRVRLEAFLASSAYGESVVCCRCHSDR